MQSDASSTVTTDLLHGTGKSIDYLQNNDISYSSIFSPQASASLLNSPLVMQHQDMINRHVLCLTRLREKAREVESLRQENATLRSFNDELTNQLSLLTNTTASLSLQNHKYYADYNTSPFDVADAFRGLCNISEGGGDELCDDESPTSVMEVQNVDTERVTLPKSISVRSNGYLKMMNQTRVAKPRGPTRPQTASPLDGTQRVYVRGGKKEEEPLELQVYHQGMFKTELCNKWQETGACPYGDHCQFAHGIEELRPVIRHPRYKTEVCRMVLAGDICPYGHRCHFRHALTEQERLMSHLKLRTMKFER
ncbi:hypothetical protein K2173_000205 [Erythroxylum novogranatense]|uniref:C3H1-type domain-containing protein n=1 Tax=Erythroxylum novogranatense TaxID=1862640 RepID=A0AAV8TQ36_9ROSI|nr:hypothetical protein K2173_000205 [Erythroxylum novogranatense]